MSAACSAVIQPAMFAGKDRAERMPSPMYMPAMCMATAASIIILGTGVLTSVSLFVLVLVVATLLLALLGVLISLSGLTGLLISLVGLVIGLDPGMQRGD